MNTWDEEPATYACLLCMLFWSTFAFLRIKQAYIVDFSSHGFIFASRYRAYGIWKLDSQSEPNIVCSNANKFREKWNSYIIVINTLFTPFNESIVQTNTIAAAQCIRVQTRKSVMIMINSIVIYHSFFFFTFFPI